MTKPTTKSSIQAGEIGVDSRRTILAELESPQVKDKILNEGTSRQWARELSDMFTCTFTLPVLKPLLVGIEYGLADAKAVWEEENHEPFQVSLRDLTNGIHNATLQGEVADEQYIEVVGREFALMFASASGTPAKDERGIRILEEFLKEQRAVERARAVKRDGVKAPKASA